MINCASTTPSVKIKPPNKYFNAKLLAYPKIKHCQKYPLYSMYNCMQTLDFSWLKNIYTLLIVSIANAIHLHDNDG